MICPNPNCGYQGPIKRMVRGSLAVGATLSIFGLIGAAVWLSLGGACIGTIFFLLPAIIYAALGCGYRHSCPKCGLQIAADN